MSHGQLELPDIESDDWALCARTLRRLECEHCGQSYERIAGHVQHDDHTVAVYFADCHRHDGPEIWLDVILGWDDVQADERTTFGCWVGQVQNGEEGATLVAAAEHRGESDIWGDKLTRDQALVHPWLSLCWEVVDLILVLDEQVAAHRYVA